MNLIMIQGFGLLALVVILLHVALGAHPPAQGTIGLVFGRDVTYNRIDMDGR